MNKFKDHIFDIILAIIIILLIAVVFAFPVVSILFCLVVVWCSINMGSSESKNFI